MHILVVDDHPVMRFGVCQILQQYWPTVTIGEAETLAQALTQLRSQHWDIVVLDLSLPDASGVEGLVQLRRAAPEVPVLIWSMHDETAFAEHALKLGAAGYLTKEHASWELLAAIDRISRGGRYISQDLAERMVHLVAGDAAPGLPHQTLSAQEYRVLLLIGEGLSASEIAERMHLSVKTVGTYRARIIDKTGLSSTAEMARYCVRHGLVGGS